MKLLKALVSVDYLVSAYGRRTRENDVGFQTDRVVLTKFSLGDNSLRMGTRSIISRSLLIFLEVKAGSDSVDRAAL